MNRLGKIALGLFGLALVLFVVCFFIVVHMVNSTLFGIMLVSFVFMVGCLIGLIVKIIHSIGSLAIKAKELKESVPIASNMAKEYLR